MKNLLFASLLIGLLLLAGCSQTLPDDIAYKAKLGEEFGLKPGELALIEPEGISVRFLNVTQDSRCPKDVQCIWAGQVSVLVKVEENGVSRGDFELTLGPGGGELAKKSFDGYSIQVFSVELPYGRTAGQKVEVTDYIGKFVVSRE